MPTQQPSNVTDRMNRVAIALDGLSVGDALGEQFMAVNRFDLVSRRAVPDPYWFYTDDTEMALAIAHVLRTHGHIEQDALAAEFARRHDRNPLRGYGATAHRILAQITKGKSWQTASRSAFDGQGSMGNGAAMRAAPVGAYFADDDAEVVRQATLSAEVTHAHPEGIAGAIAVAVAAAWAWRRGRHEEPEGTFFERILQCTPETETRFGIEKASAIPPTHEVAIAASRLGNGSRVIAQDTVPFALWCAVRHIDNYEDAIWSTLSAGGDIDTNCAIVGGIVALSAGRDKIPKQWLESREDLG